MVATNKAGDKTTNRFIEEHREDLTFRPHQIDQDQVISFVCREVRKQTIRTDNVYSGLRPREPDSIYPFEVGLRNLTSL